MKSPQATCSWCGLLIERNAPRMRLHETADSSVRRTRMVASFHPDCGRQIVDLCEVQRQQIEALRAARQTWARGARLGRAA